MRGEDEQIDAIVSVIATVQPDILVLQNFDYDYENAALAALASRFGAANVTYPHLFSLRPNTGMPTGLDMDGDGRYGGPRDAQGYGSFSGQGGMAILSRFPFVAHDVLDMSGLLWRDVPNAQLPNIDGRPFPSEQAQMVQRLSSTGHWFVPVSIRADLTLDMLTWYATPPVFDGVEDRNGKRNHDESAFWLRYLEGVFEWSPPEHSFVLVGGANLDVYDGEGRPAALRALLSHPLLQDVSPQSDGGTHYARADGGVNLSHVGNPALDTANWPDGPEGPGNLRVDYILPSVDLNVAGSGVYWPIDDDTVATASRHRLVWVDLTL